MPPKSAKKEDQKKKAQSAFQIPSDCSLLYVAEDAQEGWEEHLYKCVQWTLLGAAIRYQHKQCLRSNMPEVSFSEAFDKKVRKSVLGPFLNEESNLSLQEHWEVTLPMVTWDKKLEATDESRICFENFNNIIDDYMLLIAKAVKDNNRKIIKQGLIHTQTLRLNDCQITHLDETIKKYKCLTALIFCGNFISEINCEYLPATLRSLELQCNCIKNLDCFTNLPSNLLYLGLSKNMLRDEGILKACLLPRLITCLDLSDNDICELVPLLQKLILLPNLISLHLDGNPCAMSSGYSVTTLSMLQRLKWLDNRKVLPSDRIIDDFDTHREDLKGNYFIFSVLRIMALPLPPKPEKGAAFFVEFELPLLDSKRRRFLQYRNYESLIEYLPPPESKSPSREESQTGTEKIFDLEEEETDKETDIFEGISPVNPLIVYNFTIFESPRYAWGKVLTFPDPTLKILCPDLVALRDTFRSTVTLRLVYSYFMTGVQGSHESTTKHKGGKNKNTKPQGVEMRVTIATIKCSLKNVDWSQPQQHFHWDDTLGTEEAIHWGDGDLRLVNYQSDKKATTATDKKAIKRTDKQTTDSEDLKKNDKKLPENLTCHFSFGVLQTPAV